MLLEEDELTSGSTWHAAGLCTQFNPSYNLTGLLRYSVELYKTLAADYHECGSVRLATTQDRVDEFRHRAATAELLGVPVEVVGPERARELHPLIEVGDVLAAAYLPTDGHVDPSSLTRAFVAGAGDRIFRHTPVTALERRGGALDAHDPEGGRPGRDRRRRRRPVGAEGRPAGRRRPADRLRSSITTSSPTRFRRWRRCRGSCRSSVTRTAPSTYGRREPACSSGRSSATRGRGTSRTAFMRGCCRPTSTASKPHSRTQPRVCPPSAPPASRRSSTAPTATRPTAAA